jgi:hypothetical protein
VVDAPDPPAAADVSTQDRPGKLDPKLGPVSRTGARRALDMCDLSEELGIGHLVNGVRVHGGAILFSCL